MLDGCSRANVHWEIREPRTERDVELVPQKAKEKYPEATPRLISDNGPAVRSARLQALRADQRMDHVRTSPHYPESNGRVERWHGSLKVVTPQRRSRGGTCRSVRSGTASSKPRARRAAARKAARHQQTAVASL